MAPAAVKVCGMSEAQKLQDVATERCTMTYRAPELFNVESYCMIDQRVDIWVIVCILFINIFCHLALHVWHFPQSNVNYLLEFV